MHGRGLWKMGRAVPLVDPIGPNMQRDRMQGQKLPRLRNLAWRCCEIWVSAQIWDPGNRPEGGKQSMPMTSRGRCVSNREAEQMLLRCRVKCSVCAPRQLKGSKRRTENHYIENGCGQLSISQETAG